MEPLLEFKIDIDYGIMFRVQDIHMSYSTLRIIRFIRAIGQLITGVAQLVERATFNRVVRGSIPLTGIKPQWKMRYNKYFPHNLCRKVFRSIILVG